MTTLRSAPSGRCGFAFGSSPPAIRSVQSPYSAVARWASSRLRELLMEVMACPDKMRRDQASAEDLNSPSSLGIVRVALLPSWWQVMQPLVLTTFSHSPWLAAFPRGNSLFSGTWAFEEHLTAGYSPAAA